MVESFAGRGPWPGRLPPAFHLHTVGQALVVGAIVESADLAHKIIAPSGIRDEGANRRPAHEAAAEGNLRGERELEHAALGPGLLVLHPVPARFPGGADVLVEVPDRPHAGGNP